MMYNNQFVLAVKHSGKILREFGDKVYLPFGSEYSLLLKNLNTLRALATVTIDGTDVGDGHAFVIQPGQEMSIERFVSNLDKGNRFKFIERIKEIEQHRGIGIQDGIVQVKFQFERPIKTITTWSSPSYPWSPVAPYDPFGDKYRGGDFIQMSNTFGAVGGHSVSSCFASLNSADITPTAAVLPQNAAPGITVPGSISNQQFHVTSSFDVDPTTHSIVLMLQGGEVKEAITVKKRVTCRNCRRRCNAKAQFCTRCGTALNIIK